MNSANNNNNNNTSSPYDLTSRQLGTLLGVAPVFMHWLRDNDDRPGSLFLRNIPDTRVMPALHQLFNTISYEGDVTLDQVRELGVTYGAVVWGAAIRKIVVECDPPLVPLAVSIDLGKALPRLESSNSSVDASRILGPILDHMPRINYFALAELCALLRDSPESSSQLACLCGPLLLARRSNRGMSSDRIADQQQSAAAMAIMDMLIAECEIIFGKICARTKKFGLGARDESIQFMEDKKRREEQQAKDNIADIGSPVKKNEEKTTTNRPISVSRLDGDGKSGNNRKQPSKQFGYAKKEEEEEEEDDDDDNIPPPPPPSNDVVSYNHGNSSPRRASWLPVTTREAATDKSRKQALQAFLLWRDPTKSDTVDALFDTFGFVEVAHGIHQKYGMLPPGWRQDLQEMFQKVGQSVDWLNDDTKQTNQQSIGSSIMRRLSFRRTGGSDSRDKSPAKSSGASDNVVNEIIDSEQYYHDTIAEVLKLYVSALRDAAAGRLGDEFSNALELTSEQVENTFGWRLEGIVLTSTRLLKKLELVSLVRTEPKNVLGGRAAIVGKAFEEIAHDLHVYIPYVRAHKDGLGLIQEMSRRNKLKKPSGRELGSTSNKNRNSDVDELKPYKLEPVNFIALWEMISASSSILKGQALQSILITPVQRVPRYKLLLQELQKKLPEDHPAQIELQKATNIVSSVADQINSTLGGKSTE